MACSAGLALLASVALPAVATCRHGWTDNTTSTNSRLRSRARPERGTIPMPGRFGKRMANGRMVGLADGKRTAA